MSRGVHDQNGEFRLELEPGPALEGTASGWLAVLATRYLGAMRERPLRTRRFEQAGTRPVENATTRLGNRASRHGRAKA